MLSYSPKKKEISGLPKFNLASVDFLDKIGEGKYLLDHNSPSLLFLGK